MVYDDLANELARRHIFVFAHDHVGHGRSGGTRAFVNSMQTLVEDSIQHIKKVRQKFQDVPLFVCGHSMGGSVSALLALEKEIEVSGVVLIAPALAPNPETATFFRVTVAKLLSKLVPRFPIAHVDLTLSCRNESEVQKMENDPLRHHGYFTARSVMCLLEGAEKVLKDTSAFACPFLLLHGDGDKVCHVSGSKKLYEEARSTDKKLKIYEEAYHSLLHEPKEVAEDVFNQIVQWLDQRA